MATTKIFNGVDVIVATPPALLRLKEKKILMLNKMEHLVSGVFHCEVLIDSCYQVLDDANSLIDLFQDDIRKLLLHYVVVAKKRLTQKNPSGFNLIACARDYCHDTWVFLRQFFSNPVTLVTDSIQVFAMKKIHLVRRGC